MKALVIKNREEKYWSGCEWVEDLIFADMYTNKHDINSDVTWQEITIEETNQQNQKAIECLKEVKECFLSGVLMFDINSDLTEREQDNILEHYEEDKRILADIIDNKIKELEEKNNG